MSDPAPPSRNGPAPDSKTPSDGPGDGPGEPVRDRAEALADDYLDHLRRRRDFLARHPEAAGLLQGLLHLHRLLHGPHSPDAATPVPPAPRDGDSATLPTPGSPAHDPPDRPAGDPAGDRPKPLRRLGPFQLLEILGHGGSATVYRALDSRHGREVALKVLHEAGTHGPAFTARFRRDAALAAQVRHPHLVPVFETGETDGRAWIAMQLVRGETLEARLRRETVPFDAAADLVRKVALALHEAHEQGIIHRDVKPSNILLDTDGQPQLTDFGLARQAGLDSLTGHADILGTFDYMPPEQARGQSRAADRRADVYSLGVVLYRLLTGRLPFLPGRPVAAVIHDILHTTPPTPSSVRPEVPPELETVCLKAMARDPADRFPTAAALADELARWLSRQPIRTLRPGPAARAWRWLKDHRGATAAALLAGLALVAAGAVGVALEYGLAKRELARAGQSLTEADARASLLAARARLVQPTAGRAPEAVQHLRHAAARTRQLPPGSKRQELEQGIRTAFVQSLEGPDVRRLEASPDWPTDHFSRSWVGVPHPSGAWAAVATAAGPYAWRPQQPAGADPGRPAHRGVVLAFSPDGGLLAYAGDEGVLTLRDGATLEVRRTLSGPVPLALAFSPDGAALWTCRADGRLECHDTVSGDRRASLTLSGGEALTAAAFALGAGVVAAGDAQGRYALFGLDGRPRTGWAEMGGGARRVEVVAVSPDAAHVALMAKDGELFLAWRDSPPRVLTHAEYGDSERGLVFSPDGRWLLTHGPSAAGLSVWDVFDGCRVLVTREGVPLGFDRQGCLLTGHCQGLTTCALDAPRALVRLGGHRAQILRLAWSADGGRLAALDAGWEVRVWDIGRQTLLDRFLAPKSQDYYPVNCGLALDRAGGRVLFVGAGRSQTVALLRDTDQRRKVDRWPVGPGLSLAAHDGQEFVIVREEPDPEATRPHDPAAGPRRSVVYRVAADGPVRPCGVLRRAGPDDGRGVFSPVLSPDGRRYAWAGPREPRSAWRLELFDVPGLRPLPEPDRLQDWPADNLDNVDLWFAPDGGRLWVLGARGAVEYDLHSGSRTVSHHVWNVRSPTGAWTVGRIEHHVAAAGVSHRLRLYRGGDTAAWLDIAATAGAEPPNPRFSPEGRDRFLAWGDASGAVTVVDFDALQESLVEFLKAAAAD